MTLTQAVHLVAAAVTQLAAQAVPLVVAAVVVEPLAGAAAEVVAEEALSEAADTKLLNDNG